MSKPKSNPALALLSVVLIGVAFYAGTKWGESPNYWSITWTHDYSPPPWATPADVFEAGKQWQQHNTYTKWVRFYTAEDRAKLEEAKREARREGFQAGWEHGYSEGRTK